ncbi:MAG TPA: hypothetical protein PKN13_14930, partial [Accumulibacter sp.]|nr:hypothetical protein [Accumulibacter sp.]HND81592.1 hypothetical protein [Accumulibacter sp.]HNM76599.1 hypothetical protein [Accumulibacter sp.]
VIMGMGKSIEDYRDAIDVVQQDDGVYAADAPTLQELRAGNDSSTETVNTETGEITPPDQLEHKQPVTIPQPAAQPAAADQWRPDPEEEAAIRAAELAESQRAAQTAPRRSRERGGLGLE